jgi:hypothetical protein
MSQLRELKTAYRLRRDVLDAQPVAQWISLCEKVATASHRQSSQQVESSSNGYAALRDIERILLQNWDIAALDTGLVPREAARLWKIAISPRDYRWEVRHACKLRSTLERCLLSSSKRIHPIVRSSRLDSLPRNA